MSENVRFKSVSEMIQEVSEDANLARDVERRIKERQLIKLLIAHRVKNDMSQQDVADQLGCSQSRISKLESANDADVRLRDLEEYTKAIGLQLRMVLAPENHTAVNEIKYHAFRIKSLLQRLVNMTEDDAEIAAGISKFTCIETPLNLLKIVVDTAKHIPQKVLKRLPGFVIEDECIACEREEDENHVLEEKCEDHVADTEMQPA